MPFFRQLGFISVIVVVALLLLTTAGQEVDGDCDEGRGECKLIFKCPPYSRKFHLNQDNIIYCNIDDSLVCCPKKIPPRNLNYYGTEANVVHARECINYRNQIFPDCVKPLIIGGSKAKPKEFPFMALVGLKNATGFHNWFCGGTLISKDFVISAAHCFYATQGTPKLVRLGDIDYSTTEDDEYIQDFNISRYITHPNYDSSTQYNDIVLVRLDREATFNHYVAPACLPLTSGTEFTEFIAAGWGVSNRLSNDQSSHLLKVKLDAFTDTDCAELTESDQLMDGVRNRSQLCAGSHTDVRDTCNADSGGPLFVSHPDVPCMFMMVAITSFGTVCGFPGVPGVYTRVSWYTDWIQMVVWNATTQFG